MTKYWLMKAEPESRIVKGKDVKFSVDDFEASKITAWEGVSLSHRNHEAKNLMKEMKVGDAILFYHSSCKVPGIAGFAKVSKEAYPDYTAWDSSHPYFDAKSSEDEPKWLMIDATFSHRAKHFVPLSLFRNIASLPTSEPPEEIEYICVDGVKGIKDMDLVVRGRLSIQRVNENAWKAINLLAEKGGWDKLLERDGKKSNGQNTSTAGHGTKRKRAAPGSTSTSAKGQSRKKGRTGDTEATKDDPETSNVSQPPRRSARKKSAT